MLADLSIIPVGGSTHTSGLLAEVLRIVDSSGIRYQLTPTATVLEGTWEEITAVAQRCHAIARKASSHVVTMLRFEDDGDDQNKLLRNVASVEEKAEQALNQTPQEATNELSGTIRLTT